MSSTWHLFLLDILFSRVPSQNISYSLGLHKPSLKILKFYRTCTLSNLTPFAVDTFGTLKMESEAARRRISTIASHFSPSEDILSATHLLPMVKRFHFSIIIIFKSYHCYYLGMQQSIGLAIYCFCYSELNFNLKFWILQLQELNMLLS